MIELKTNQALLDKLQRLSSKSLTQEMLEKQRSSFVYGVLSSENNMTKQEVREVIARQSGERVTA
ncbi:MAG: hypothetical protein AXW12_08715 [Thalassospira sp. Nap_22]|nr:MAG: hypothetical protein AXW12_08715 [Thalassospira sp. Nap_22]